MSLDNAMQCNAMRAGLRVEYSRIQSYVNIGGFQGFFKNWRSGRYMYGNSMVPHNLLTVGFILNLFSGFPSKNFLNLYFLSGPTFSQDLSHEPLSNMEWVRWFWSWMILKTIKYSTNVAQRFILKICYYNFLSLKTQ